MTTSTQRTALSRLREAFHAAENESRCFLLLQQMTREIEDREGVANLEHRTTVRSSQERVHGAFSHLYLVVHEVLETFNDDNDATTTTTSSERMY